MELRNEISFCATTAAANDTLESSFAFLQAVVLIYVEKK
jgi:hypothetical protein